MEKVRTENIIESLIYYRLFNSIFTGGNYRFTRYLLENIQFSTFDRILDIGGGDGKSLSSLRNQMKNQGVYYSLEPSRELIQYGCRRYPGIKWVNGYIQDGRFFDNFFDYVITSFVFHHMAPEMKKKAILEIIRILKPGGYFLYVDIGKPDTLYTKIITHIMSRYLSFWYEYIPSQINNEVIDLMKRAGLKIKKCIKKTVVNGRVYCIIACKE